VEAMPPSYIGFGDASCGSHTHTILKVIDMKVIAVLGSPTRHGNTCVLAREVLEGAREAGADTEELFLAEKRIEFCRGCISRNIEEMCMSTGRCVVADDVGQLRESLCAADGIILASPSYGLRPTARMKNFLVDRIGMYTTYTSGLGAKYFVGVSTCGGIGAKKVARDLANEFLVGFHLRSYRSGYIHAKLGYERVECRPALLRRARQLGRKLAEDITARRNYPLQKMPKRLLTGLVVRSLIIHNIRENKDGCMKAVYENLVARGLLTPA
jgi:multimeric flavodoxin WrbA